MTLSDPVDCSPPGSSVHGILQARIPEWLAISFSRESSQLRDRTQVSCVSCIGRQISSPLCNLGSLPSLLQLANYQHGVRSSVESHTESEIKASVSQIHNFPSYLLVLIAVKDFIHLYNNAHSCKESLLKNVHM